MSHAAEVVPGTDKGYDMLEDRLCMNYEYLVRSAFDCGRLRYRFADVGFCRCADKYPDAFVAILECTLFILANRHDRNEAELRRLLDQLDDNPTLECAEEIIIEMDNKAIVY